MPTQSIFFCETHGWVKDDKVRRDAKGQPICPFCKATCTGIDPDEIFGNVLFAEMSPK